MSGLERCVAGAVAVAVGAGADLIPDSRLCAVEEFQILRGVDACIPRERAIPMHATRSS